MKNKEKFSKEIVELACDGNRIAVVRQTGEFRSCYGMSCRECLFHSNTERCKEKAREWAESEYVERPVISKRDRTFLDYIKEGFKYIARDENDKLYAYDLKPYKNKICSQWSVNNCNCLTLNYNVDFPMIKWSDGEPWLIEDLKKLEVVEEYE